MHIEENVRRFFLVDVASAPAAVILLGNKSTYQRHTVTTTSKRILYPVYAQPTIKQVLLLLLQLVALLRRGSPLSNEAINSGICSSTIVSKYLGIQQLKE